MVKNLFLSITVATFVVAASAAHAGVDPDLKCKDAKCKAAGLKASKLMKAFGKNIKKPDDLKLRADISKAQSKFTKLFTKAEQEVDCGINAGGVEPEVDGCVKDLIALIAEATTTTTTTPGSTTTTTLPVPCDFPATGQTTPYGTGSDGDVEAGATLSYTDNGDGTITDNNTALIWEKKDDAGGIHDYNNTYTWGMTSSPYTMNGTMVTTFLATLNTPPCFAGHCDWRIPNYKELTSILDLERSLPAADSAFNTVCVPGCTVDGLGGPMCSCTGSDGHWSSTSVTDGPSVAWTVGFGGGTVTSYSKSGTYYVRTVRGGSTRQYKGCIGSGGTTATELCCLGVGGFPQTCYPGPCGCSPSDSHDVLVCKCGPGKCFNGEECVIQTPVYLRWTQLE